MLGLKLIHVSKLALRSFFSSRPYDVMAFENIFNTCHVLFGISTVFNTYMCWDVSQCTKYFIRNVQERALICPLCLEYMHTASCQGGVVYVLSPLQMPPIQWLLQSSLQVWIMSPVHRKILDISVEKRRHLSLSENENNVDYNKESVLSH